MHPTEAGRLVRAAAANDAAAWTALVEGFSGLIWSVARGYRLSHADAADVFQTTWLRLAEHLSRIQNPDRVGAWLATTARHESLRVARGAARLVLTADPDMLDPGEADEKSPEQALLDSEQAALDDIMAARLWRAFGALSDRCQKLLRVLIATPPPNYADVAAALDMPVGSIGPTRARCLRQLRQRLAGEVSETV
ncbi:MAG TPA: sigma-70 family RNA polymerase sigma factor [Streptosporangiaceae bacterium]|nr:sigma-70 family RNA polymerase sigma factor [Streptosporangiaceae bacterium]